MSWVLLLAAALVMALGGLWLEAAGPVEGALPCGALFAGAALLTAVYLLVRFHEEQTRVFLRWLREHAAEVAAGRAEYAGAPLARETMLVRYRATVSLVLVILHLHSRFYVAARPGERRPGRATRLAFTLITLLLGWWTPLLWRGALHSVRAIRANLAGGVTLSVGELLEQEG
jgi:hypothetical protein